MANSPDSADALVDIANVVRDETLGGCGPAGLDRLERVAGALTELYGSAGVALFGIADRALYPSEVPGRPPAPAREAGPAGQPTMFI